MTYFDPQPGTGDLPVRLPSPFDPGPPHPIARRAAELVMVDLQRGHPLPVAAFEEPQRGKMFGVLVVADGAGHIGYLRGFSGKLGAQGAGGLGSTWHVAGFVGPLFDAAHRDSFWPAGAAELDEFDRELHEIAFGPATSTARATLAALQATHAAATAGLHKQHLENLRCRHEARDRITSAAQPGAEQQAALHALAQQSRADAAALHLQRTLHQEERAEITGVLLALEQRRVAVQARQIARSTGLLNQIFTGYQIPSARGTSRSLCDLFAPKAPPGGSGDCAAPKLFGQAHRAGLRPIALAEFWWGAPPVTGGRHTGVYYPACRGKCGPVLAHMIDGLAVDPAPIFGDGPVAAGEPRTVFEDRWLAVVEKPAGLLSVPGRSLLADSVLTRLRARFPEAAGPLLAHRLDLDTSGLMLAAKDARTHAALQAQFLRREIDKRYIAHLDGHVAGERGIVELALRVDVDDRPRQIHDAVHGKTAITEWQVVERTGARTRVALFPRTGRTHQLRVHAAHPQGLGAPIVGDRLYGRPGGGERLMLHAESLAFVHPHTGARMELTSPAPFF